MVGSVSNRSSAVTIADGNACDVWGGGLGRRGFTYRYILVFFCPFFFLGGGGGGGGFSRRGRRSEFSARIHTASLVKTKKYYIYILCTSNSR